MQLFAMKSRRNTRNTKFGYYERRAKSI